MSIMLVMLSEACQCALYRGLDQSVFSKISAGDWNTKESQSCAFLCTASCVTLNLWSYDADIDINVTS